MGEAPGGDVSIADRPGLALTGDSGKRLARLAGMSFSTYLRTYDRTNLFSDPQPDWHAKAAALSAELMLPQFTGRNVLLLGAKVADAFSVRDWDLYVWRTMAGGNVVRVPHPSGRNLVLNIVSERALYGAVLRMAADLS